MGKQLAVSFALCLALLTGAMTAQSDDPSRSTGLPYSAYHGSDMDTVDLDSGNLRIAIPLVSTKGRGLDTDFTLSFNSKIFNVYEGNDPINGPYYYDSFDGDNVWWPATGWSIGDSKIGFFTTFQWVCKVEDASSPGHCLDGYNYATVTTDDGRRHVFASQQVTNPSDTFRSFDGITFWVHLMNSGSSIVTG